MLNSAISLVVAALSVLSIAVFITYPPPALSDRLQKWKQMGYNFTRNGHKIFYIDLPGSGQAGTVICLHGFPTSSFDWIKILPKLKNDFSRIVMLDFLGFGFSDKPTDVTYTISEQANIVENLATHLKIASAHVLSHDYGDTVALEILARFDSSHLGFKMMSLTMLNGGIFPDTHHPRPIQKLLLKPLLGHLASYLYSHFLFCRGFGAVFGENQPSKSDFEDFWAALRYNNGDRATYKVINFLRERQQFKVRWVEALKRTKLNVLMIYGPADPVNPPAFVAHFKKVVPSQQIVTLDPSIGHYPQWEDPESVTQALQEFINGL